MGWRFRKSVKLLPGIRLNFGKRGFSSATFGKGFFKTNVSKKGVKHTVSIPGTGVSYQTKTKTFDQNSNNHNQQSDSLYWYCKTCYTANSPDGGYCRNCGDSYNPNPQQLTNGAKSAPKLGTVIIFTGIGFFVLVYLIALISTFSTKSDYSQVAASPTPFKSFTTTEQNIETPISKAPSTKKVPLKNVPAKSATVITENANLRKTGNQDGEVIQTIPQGATIEVLQQKGAWFLVNYGTTKGWMHGNTIRYDDSPPTTTDVPSFDSSESTSSYSPPISSSSSSSYDYRPKTVYVRGYTRRDGTYVAPYMRRAPRRR